MTPPHAEEAHGHEKNSTIKWVVGIGLGLVFAALVVAVAVMVMTAPAGSRPAEPKMTLEQENGLLKMKLSEVGKGPPSVACPTPREFDVAKPSEGASVAVPASVLTMVPQDCNGPRYVAVDANGLTPWIRVDTRNGYRLAAESVPLSAEWKKELRPDEDDHGYTWLYYEQVPGTVHFTSVKLTLRLVGTSAK
jgi:hypothetical protein